MNEHTEDTIIEVEPTIDTVIDHIPNLEALKTSAKYLPFTLATIGVMALILLFTILSISRLSTLNNELLIANETLTVKIDYLENGADKQLLDIKNAFSANEYDKVISLSKTLNQDFNGTAQDIEAQQISIKSQNLLKEQKAKQQAEASKTAMAKAREIIRVKKLTFDMDSAGGVDVYIHWQNNSNKDIKYATFTVTPFNSVGDEVFNHSKYDATTPLQDTGPFKKGQGSNSDTYWSTVWYNSSTKKIKLDKVDIEYMDGSTYTIEGKDTEYIQY